LGLTLSCPLASAHRYTHSFPTRRSSDLRFVPGQKYEAYGANELAIPRRSFRRAQSSQLREPQSECPKLLVWQNHHNTFPDGRFWFGASNSGCSETDVLKPGTNIESTHLA